MPMDSTGPDSPSAERIALVLHGFEAGGAQRRTLALAGALAGLGAHIDLLVVRADGPLRAELPPTVRLTVVGGPAARLPGRSLRMAAAIPALAAWVRRERPDVLMAAANHAALATVLAYRLAGVPGTALAVRVSNAMVGGRERLRDRLRRWAVRRTYGAVDAALCVSADLARETAALLPELADRVLAIPNPVVEDDVAARAALPPPHPWLADGGPPVILGLGRLVRQKDFPTLLRAVARVWARRPVRLLILGEGEERGWLTRLAEDLGIAGSVALPGFVPNPFPALAGAAGFVLSSRWEGMPGALIEAMAVGCPVASTDCPGGSREILEDGRLGPLVPVGDDLALAQAIETLLDRPADRAALMARARDFSVAGAALAYRDALRDAAARAARRCGRTSG